MDLNAIVGNFRNTVTQHYFDMKGRVGRERFWYFVLACAVVQIGASILQSVVFLPVAALTGLALLLPMAGMGARRLQDTGRDGNLVWLGVIPAALGQIFQLFFFGPFGIFGEIAYALTIGPLLGIAGLIAAVVLIYFWCQPGDADANAYGAAPDGSIPAVTP
ncbi:MAG TPA: DUF805 domain-containing protein [Rhizomicrobium sp.]